MPFHTSPGSKTSAGIVSTTVTTSPQHAAITRATRPRRTSLRSNMIATSGISTDAPATYMEVAAAPAAHPATNAHHVAERV